MRLMPRKRRFWKAWPERAPRFSFRRPGLAPGPIRRVSSFRQCGGYRPSQPTPGVMAPGVRRDDVTGDRDSHNSAFSRRHSPEFYKSSAPKIEGAGKTGCALHPRSRVPMHMAKNAHEHTGSAEAVRPSLRNGFTAYFVLSPARPGLFATVALRKRELPKNLTPATGASYDFAVRVSHARQSQPPRPTTRFVTCATPLSSGGMATEVKVICPRDQR